MTSVVRYLCALPLMLALLCAGAAWADPPGRVGRLSVLDGNVSLRPADSRQWEDATRNWPLTSGDALDTGRRSRAEIRIGSSIVRLDGSTTIDVRQLDDERIRILLERGSVAVRVRSTDPTAAIEIETPGGLVVADEPGQYRVDYEDGTTTLTNHRGGDLEFRAVDSDVVVTEGRRAQIVFTDRTEVRWDEADTDDFADWSLARDARDDRVGRPRHVSPEMTGVEDLYEYGDWRDSGEYGTVWYPRDVPYGWAPYRTGRWVSIDPWGWTWIDEAPWGFAPFHYGRWVLLSGVWAWVPGAYVARPIYAPALVVWMGVPGVSVSVTSGRLPHVGWFPLAPREVYVPSYRHSPTYVRQINITHVTNVVNITRIVEEPRRARYIYRDHRDAVTVVPGDVLRLSRPVQRDALREVERNWREKHAITPVPPIDPRLVAERQRRERAAQPRDEDRLRDEQIRRAERVRAAVEERHRRERAGEIRRPGQLREGDGVRRGDIPPLRDHERDRSRAERRSDEREGNRREDVPPLRDYERDRLPAEVQRKQIPEPPRPLVNPQEQDRAARERERQEERQRMLDGQQQERRLRERQQQDEERRQQRERREERIQSIQPQERDRLRQEQIQQQQEQLQRQQRDRERQQQLQQRQQQLEQGQERERQQEMQQRERNRQQERMQIQQQQQERARTQQLQHEQQERARAQQAEQQQQERARAEAERRRVGAQQEMRQAPPQAAPRGQSGGEPGQGKGRRFNDDARPDN